MTKHKKKRNKGSGTKKRSSDRGLHNLQQARRPHSEQQSQQNRERLTSPQPLPQKQIQIQNIPLPKKRRHRLKENTAFLKRKCEKKHEIDTIIERLYSNNETTSMSLSEVNESDGLILQDWLAKTEKTRRMKAKRKEKRENTIQSVKEWGFDDRLVNLASRLPQEIFGFQARREYYTDDQIEWVCAFFPEVKRRYEYFQRVLNNPSPPSFPPSNQLEVIVTPELESNFNTNSNTRLNILIRNKNTASTIDQVIVRGSNTQVQVIHAADVNSLFSKSFSEYFIYPIPIFYSLSENLRKNLVEWIHFYLSNVVYNHCYDNAPSNLANRAEKEAFLAKASTCYEMPVHSGQNYPTISLPFLNNKRVLIAYTLGCCSSPFDGRVPVEMKGEHPNQRSTPFQLSHLCHNTKCCRIDGAHCSIEPASVNIQRKGCNCMIRIEGNDVDYFDVCVCDQGGKYKKCIKPARKLAPYVPQDKDGFLIVKKREML